jgi:serine/threonine protein kinase
LVRPAKGTEHVKLIDFGIARTRERTTEDLTLTGVVPGTPAYMAPEVLTTGEANAQADVWGLGLVLHLLLTGVPAFSGAASGTPTQLHETAKLPSELGVAVPETIEAILLRCLARDPAARYANALELSVALANEIARLG